jgi:branched-chain amino acid transport system ATP-binding protein
MCVGFIWATTMTSKQVLLHVESLCAGYGDSIIIEDINFSLAAGSSLALLGRNGVGKSTLLRTLLGHARQRSGVIRFNARDISATTPYARIWQGLGWVPQERLMFPSLTVAEHLAIADRKGAWTSERVYKLFPRLKERQRNLGGQLSGGEQQMLAIARALMTNPTLLLLDEPLEGLAPIVVKEVGECIRRLVEDEGQAIILVEQRVKFALRLTEAALVLDRGRVAYSGSSNDLLNDIQRLDDLIGLRSGSSLQRKRAGSAVAAREPDDMTAGGQS